MAISKSSITLKLDLVCVSFYNGSNPIVDNKDLLFHQFKVEVLWFE